MTHRLDHIAIATTDLATGTAALEAALGVPLAPGGQHPAMGTHNRLLSLGPREYLEVIAIDPAAPPPGRPRWFALDAFSGPPRLTNWIAACNDIDAALAQAPEGAGQPMALSRGDLRWQMAVPADGVLPFGGAFPALIRWEGDAHPAARLPDHGLRLRALRLRHPQAAALAAALAPMLAADPRITVTPGPAPALAADIETPAGMRTLG